MTNPRRVALDALVRIEDGAFAHILVPQLLARTRLPGRDRGLVTELVYGTVRMQRALDFQLARVSNQAVPDLEPDVRAAVRLGAYQLFIGIPAHAAVSETVEVVAARQRGFVNGVLRALARVGPPWSWPAGREIGDLGVRTSHPDWIVELLVAEYGMADALATLALASEPAPVTLRVNPMRATPESVERELRSAGVDSTRGELVPEALVLREPGDIGALAPVREGRATPQDQASQAVADTLGAQPGDRVLDIAAAPGGKTGAIGERMGDTGLVVAEDAYAGRMRLLRRGMARLGLEHVHAIVADGRSRPVRAAAFDRVLLDAPCSGLGVLRRRPDARWRVQPEDVDTLAALQQAMLLEAAAAVCPGGRLVYAVCTLTAAETTAIDTYAERTLPEFVAVEHSSSPWRAHGRGALLLPSDARTDGMYVLVLERVNPSGAVRPD